MVVYNRYVDACLKVGSLRLLTQRLSSGLGGNLTQPGSVQFLLTPAACSQGGSPSVLQLRFAAR